MARIIAVSLQKGGVGKTTTAQHLGHALALNRRRILLIDADPQGSLSQRYDLTDMRASLADVLGIDGPPTATLADAILPTYQENLWLVPAAREPEDESLSAAQRRLVQNDKGKFIFDIMLRRNPLPFDFDYVIIDTAPGEGELQIAALVAADEVILPVQLSPLGMEGFRGIDSAIVRARDLQELTGSVRLELRVVLPTFHSVNEITSRNFLVALQNAEHPDYEDLPLPVAPMPVVETTAFERASNRLPSLRRSRTIFEMGNDGDDSPTSRGQEAYMKLAEYVEQFA